MDLFSALSELKLYFRYAIFIAVGIALSLSMINLIENYGDIFIKPNKEDKK